MYCHKASGRTFHNVDPLGMIKLYNYLTVVSQMHKFEGRVQVKRLVYKVRESPWPKKKVRESLHLF